ncbi:hypothetical protein B0H67DRAFT_593851 [Lasiosphaeris hirsuta]|uniref:Uncharacterized protein n=1 Tax=Lasiosphaeris hirsuta TaxID=260670 RepID=A0AA39ZXB5_9PEZI|nr:hypothetical protein B0H67DRAFT_593851 [Lasiosphaeris hirsuta]
MTCIARPMHVPVTPRSLPRPGSLIGLTHYTDPGMHITRPPPELHATRCRYNTRQI